MVYHLTDGLVYTAFQVHWVGTCGNILQTFVHDSLCKDGGCGCSVARIVASLAGNTLDELCACVLKLVLQFNFLGYRNAVFRNLRGAKLLLNHHIAALRTQCYLYCVGQLVDTLLQQVAGFCVKLYCLCHDMFCLQFKI